MLPADGAPAAEIVALICELQGEGWLPYLWKDGNPTIREAVKA